MKTHTLLLFAILFTSVFTYAQSDTISNYRNWVVSEDSSEQKIALVIGNSLYEKNGKLAYPARDAKKMSDVLVKKGYDVQLGLNLNRQEMQEIILEFGKKYRSYDEGIIFYAGHGFSIDGVNYLIPVDADPEGKWEVSLKCIQVGTILNAIKDSEKPKVIILDACRDNPFLKSWSASDRGVGNSGLTSVESLRNSLIIFSTVENTTVLDDNPFSRSLSSAINAGGCIEDIVKKVSMEVRIIDENQIVWREGILTSSVCFPDQSGKIPSPVGSPIGELSLTDSDGDGIGDSTDNCPGEKGVPENNGCPPLSSVKWMKKIYNRSTGREELYDEAILLSRAKSADAKAKLGHMMAKGLGIPYDVNSAAKLFQESAAAENGFGMYNLGQAYRYGEGVDINVKTAAFWFKKSAEAGDSYGMWLLGESYETGKGVVQDSTKALKWYMKSASMNNPEGQFYLARLYSQGKTAEEKSKAYSIAFKNYVLAAENGHPVAQNNVGYLLWVGKGVPQDREASKKWFKMGAQNGNRDAQDMMNHLGLSWE